MTVSPARTLGRVVPLLSQCMRGLKAVAKTGRCSREFPKTRWWNLSVLLVEYPHTELIRERDGWSVLPAIHAPIPPEKYQERWSFTTVARMLESRIVIPTTFDDVGRPTVVMLNCQAFGLEK